MKVEVRNSYSRIIGSVDPVTTELLSQVLTYQNDIESEKGNLFYQMKRAKQNGHSRQAALFLSKIKHLEATEFVCLYKKGTFPTGLLNIVLETLKVSGNKYQIDDIRRSPSQNVILRWENKPHELRYYQSEMLKLGLENGRGVIESAVGSGKSLVMACLAKDISVTSLIVVPSRGLGQQTYNNFVEWFGFRNVELLDADKIRKLKKPKAISIVTVQSLGSLKKSGEFLNFIKHIDALFVDEIHHAGASTYTSLLDDLDNVYYRFGFSGSFLRNDGKTLEMWSFLSNVLYTYPAHQAITEGYLTPMRVSMYDLPSRPHRNYQKEYDNHYSANPAMLDKIQSIIQEARSGDQILILVNKKDKCGKIIHEYLNLHGIENSYISGDNTKEDINHTISAFNDKKINVLIGSSVIGEGIDIRSTDHLIMAQGGKSEITIVQAVGRLIRLFPGKELGYLHDFRFVGSNYLEKHADERCEIYDRNFKCEVVSV